MSRRPPSPRADHPRPPRAASLALPGALLIAACLDPTHPAPPTAPDAGAALAILDVQAQDARGAPWPLGALPRAPSLLVLSSRPLAPDPGAVLLLSGPWDEALMADLARRPLRDATAARALRVELASRAGGLLVTPADRLAPGALLTLGIAGWATDERGAELGVPFVAALGVAEGGELGAAPTASWPADGTAGVPTRLPLLAVRFDGALGPLVPGGVRLLGRDGEATSASVALGACAQVGYPDGTCVLVVPRGALDAGVVYRLEVSEDLRDATGTPVGPWSASFRTDGGADPGPPALLPVVCALDERETEGLCVLEGDDRVALRLAADRPYRAFLRWGPRVGRDVAPRGEGALELPELPPSALVDAQLELVALSGASTRVPLALVTHAPLSALSITEVRADPRGPEPRQEYVEVLSSAAVPIDLRGCSLTDDPTRVGDVVATSVIVPPFGRALLVADGFDPEDPRDERPAPGTPLVRLGSSLANAGLSNAGEHVILRDAEGRRLSEAPAAPAPRPGVCVVRAVVDPRTGRDGSFVYDAAGGCTPGRPDRLP